MQSVLNTSYCGSEGIHCVLEPGTAQWYLFDEWRQRASERKKIQIPIKLFHKALAQWTPKPDRSLRGTRSSPLADAQAVSCQMDCFGFCQKKIYIYDDSLLITAVV